jgi:hypothetical protein
VAGDRLLDDDERSARVERSKRVRQLRDHPVAERDPDGQVCSERGVGLQSDTFCRGVSWTTKVSD